MATEIHVLKAEAIDQVLRDMQTKVGEAEGYSESALAAKDAAQTTLGQTETARDAAFSNADVYADQATGRAAVADGEQFAVVSGAYLIRYERVSAGVSTEVSRMLNKTGTDQLIASLGNRISEVSISRNLANGAVSEPYGLTVPSGQTGASAFVQTILPFEGAGKAGDTMRIVLDFATTATFTRPLALTLQVRINNSSNANRTATVTQETVSGKTVFTVDYVLQGDETDLRPYVLITGSPTATASDETYQITAIRPAYLHSADKGQTATDKTVGALKDETLSEAYQNSMFGIGNRVGTDGFLYTPQVFNGAVRGENLITIPAGQVGNNTLLQSRWDIDGANRVGQKILLRIGFTTSEPFTRTTNNVTFQVKTAGGDVSRTSSAKVTVSVDGTRRIYSIEYTLQGDETKLMPFFQLVGGGAAATEETIELKEFLPYFLTTASDIETVADGTLENRIDERINAIGSQDYLFGLGDLLAANTWLPQAQNGAVIVPPYTVNFPSGQVGNVTILQMKWTPDAPKAGRQIKVKLAFTTSATFTRSLGNIAFQVNTSGGLASRTATVTREDIGSRIIFTCLYTMQGDEVDIRPYVTTSNASPAATDEAITATDFTIYYLTGGDDVLTTADEVLNDRFAEGAAERLSAARTVAYEGVPAAIADTIKTIATSGGDYTSFGEALAAINDATADNRYEVRVGRGVYEEDEWFDEDYVDFIGAAKDECIINFDQPDNTSTADIIQHSAFYMRRTSKVEGLTVLARNARYAIHLESSKGGPNRVQDIVNCHVEHLGNDDAVNNTWVSQNGFGSGLSSGQVVRLRDSTIISKNAVAFSYHTNIGFVAPTLVKAEGCAFTTHSASNGASAFLILPIGSFQKDRCHLVGNVFGGDISYSISPWLPTALNEQPADHAEVHVTGYGNSPAVFRNTDFGEALRVQSATTGASSTVAIAGSAAAVIFGDGTNNRHFTRKGSAGFSGAVWGWGDVSTTPVGPTGTVQEKTLGKRLGDCTGTSKTLTVTVDGGSAITVTFNQNHTNQTNATVLGIINAALGSAAVADTFKPGARYRPNFSDEEKSLKNTSGSGILMGSVLAYDGSMQNVRLMTSADAGNLFAGIAWEDIEAGKRGRVKTRGWLPIADVLRSDSGGLTFGGSMSVGATPGKVEIGGSQGLLSAVRGDAVQVG